MRIGFHGELRDEPEVRAGFIGCGSHAFRNIFPALQFAPVRLVATCDLDGEKARAFAGRFGAERAYADHREMLEREDIDAVFVVTGYDERGRPQYPTIAEACLRAGRHVWMEKPPAASCREIERMQQAAGASGKLAMVGLKKAFAPANEQAKALAEAEESGGIALATLQYPQHVPTVEELERYLRGEHVGTTIGFLDHLCHPASLLVYLLGMPETLFYERSASGAGAAVFTFASGAVATLALTHGAAHNGGMERTMIVSKTGGHIIVDGSIRVSQHRDPVRGYGDVTTFFAGRREDTTAVWEPEFSLGQLYNKGLFLLGYWGEVNEFARCVLEGRQPEKGTLEQAWQVTRIFEGFAEGPGKVVRLAR